jgi:four helix bundle protein
MGKSFRELDVWQRAMELAVAVYKLTTAFPDSERFGLVSQLRRAAVSIPSNISEGSGRATKGEYLQFLGHARGSAFEVETQLELARVLGFGKEDAQLKTSDLCTEVGKMLRAMMQSLQS